MEILDIWRIHAEAAVVGALIVSLLGVVLLVVAATLLVARVVARVEAKRRRCELCLKRQRSPVLRIRCSGLLRCPARASFDRRN